MSALWTPLLSAFPQAQTTAGAVLSDLGGEASAATIVSPLPSQGILAVTGPEASKFLQGQTSTDFREVSDEQSRLGCYVSLKGRAVTSYRAVQQGEQIRLVMDAALVPVVKDKIGKFIVFSKATLQVDESTALLGLAGPDAAALVAALVGTAPEAADAVVAKGDVVAVRLHGADRFLLLVKDTALSSVWQQLSAQATPAGENAWRLRQIEAGVAQVTAASTELFQPQELNYQVLLGVSYNKGCYTGQEIVARLYFRGKLKQHVQRFSSHTSTLPAPGTALFASAKHAADVVLAAQRSADTIELLAIARPEHTTDLHLGSEDGPALSLLPLPYEVPAQE